MFPLAYLGLIVATNLGFARLGPAFAVFVIVGLTLAVRDLVQERHGRRMSLGLVLIGAGISAALAAPAVAVASLVAFALAETLDLLVYSHVRRRFGKPAGILASGVAGSIVDSAVFLAVALGSLSLFPQQVTGKIGATIAAAIIAATVGRIRRRA